MTLTLDSQSCAILADRGPLGRHSRQDLVHKLRGMGRRGHVVVVDKADGEKVAALNLDLV